MIDEKQLTNLHAEASTILKELDSTAQLAEQALEKSAVQQEVPEAESEEERADRQAARVKKYAQRAAKQRNMGREEMARTYVGTMVVERDLKFFDPHLASSIVRFLALTDRTLHLLARVGVQYMSDAQMEQVRESIKSKVDAYAHEAYTAVSAARELERKGRDESLMWIEPQYAAPALDEKFQCKTRDVLRLIDAASHWDEAVKLMCQSQFNDAVTTSQTSEVRLRERRLFSDINRFCATLVIGMRNRTLEKIDAATSGKNQEVPTAEV